MGIYAKLITSCLCCLAGLVLQARLIFANTENSGTGTKTSDNTSGTGSGAGSGTKTSDNTSGTGSGAGAGSFTKTSDNKRGRACDPAILKKRAGLVRNKGI
jgi:hypothetical protein